MLFNSIEYLFFLPVCFLLYWFVFNKNKERRNIFILSVSYIFYAWWDWRFLGLIILSTLVDFGIAREIENTNSKNAKKSFLYVSIATNLSLLGFFKYFNFFIESWIDSMQSLGLNASANTLNIILPIGISFYTFQTLSYTIDVYRGHIKPSKTIITFAAYVAFFPQLVAGPIERATNLLPQFNSLKEFDLKQAISGIHLIVWGLFQKIVIADNCATYVNAIFKNYENLDSLTLSLGAVYFAFQIYGDFAGYTNIAIGSARLFGFDLMRNFNYPYFSRDIAEFWRRWHISLSTWFRDYLYIPLGGSRGSLWSKIRNVFVIFLISGFWHGANWTLVFWGFLHALFFMPLLLINRNRKFLNQVAANRLVPNLKEIFQIGVTFSLVCIAWIFFRANSLSEAFKYVGRIINQLEFKITYLSIERYNIEMLLILLVFILLEWTHRKQEHPFQGKYKWIKINFIILMILILGVYSNHNDFIYFQF